jgi:hypothetical protein
MAPILRSASADRSSRRLDMKKTLTAFTTAAVIAGTLAMAATDASAQRWRPRGPGWVGPAVGLGIIGGLAAGAILATRPRGYVVYQGYGQPVYRSGCYWASEPIYDRRGRIIGYTGEPVQVCP